MRHLMVDEFQDTSRIQSLILSRLTETHGNIVVVGDDDQSIYRFRGASSDNLLEFPAGFEAAAWWSSPPTTALTGTSLPP